MQTQKLFILRIYRGLFYVFLCLSPVTYASNDSIPEKEIPEREVSAKRRNLRLFFIPSFTLLSEGLFHKDEIVQQPPLSKLTNTNPHKYPLRLKQIGSEGHENLNSIDNKSTDESRNAIRSLNKFCEDYNKLSGEYPYRYNSTLLPGDENGTIITCAPQRELLAQILDLKIMIARLKSQFAYWKEERTIRKTILAQFKNKMASAGSTSYLGYVPKPNIVLEAGEIKMALPPETQLALYKQEFLKHKQVLLKRKKNVKPVVKSAYEAEAWEIDETILPSIIRNEYDQSGETSTKLIHHYNYAHRLSIPELRKQLSELERQYQGITRREKEKSLLSRFKQVMMKELKLNKLEVEFYKKISPDSFQNYYVPVRNLSLTVQPTDIVLGYGREGDIEKDIDYLKRFDLSTIRSLSLKGKELNFALLNKIQSYLGKMKNLSNLCLLFMNYEVDALKQLFSNLTRPLLSLKIGPSLEFLRLPEIKTYKEIGKLHEFILPNQNITPHNDHLLEVLSKMSSLTSLNLENNSNIMRLDVGRFGNRLTELHKLQKLNFNHTQMTSRFLEVLISIIHNHFHTSLKEISVKDNPNLTAFDVCELKEKFPNATILSSIESEEMELASTAITDSKKQHVCIEDLSDTEDDSEKISELRLYHLPKIETLFLKGTNFNSRLFQFIDQYLFGMKNLCEVHLHFDFFERGVLQKFFENINSSLTSLQLGPNLQAVRLPEIKAYKKIGGLSKFILPSLRQGQEYMSHLEDVLSRMSSLTNLNFKGNYNLIHGLDEKRKIRLGIILVQYLPKLQVLNLEDTVMTNERVSLFIKDTKDLLQNLNKINIANNNLVTKEFIEQLKGAFPNVFIKTQKSPVSKGWVMPTSHSSSEVSTSE